MMMMMMMMMIYKEEEEQSPKLELIMHGTIDLPGGQWTN